MTAKIAKKMSFEEALKQLEGLVQKMESGDLVLDDALQFFEEGIGLAQFCEQKLTEAEGKIETLLKAAEAVTEHDLTDDSVKR